MPIEYIADLAATLIGAIGFIEVSGFGYGIFWKARGRK